MKKLLSKMKIFHLILLVLSGVLIISALPFKTQYNYIYVNVSTTVEASTKETLDDLSNKQEYLFALFNMTGYDTNADGSMKSASTNAKITADGEFAYDRELIVISIEDGYYKRATDEDGNYEYELATPYTYSTYRRVTIKTADDFDAATTYYVLENSDYVELTDRTSVDYNAYYVVDVFKVWANVDYFKLVDGEYVKVNIDSTAPIYSADETEFDELYTYKYVPVAAGSDIEYVSAGIGGTTLTQFEDGTVYYVKTLLGDYDVYETSEGLEEGVEYFTQTAYYTKFDNSSTKSISLLAPISISNYNRATDFEYNKGSFDSYKKQVYDFQVELNDLNNLILWFGIISLIGVAFLYFFANNSRRIYYKSNIIISAVYTLTMVVFGIIIIAKTMGVMADFTADSDLYNYVYVMQNSDINTEIYRDILGSSNPSMSAVKEYFSCNVATFIGYTVLFVVSIAYVVFVFILSLLKYKDTAERRQELEKVVATLDK